jgi:hypothetical protein
MTFGRFILGITGFFIGMLEELVYYLPKRIISAIVGWIVETTRNHTRGVLALYSVAWLVAMCFIYYFYTEATKSNTNVVWEFLADQPRAILVSVGAAMLGTIAINFKGLGSHLDDTASEMRKWSTWYLVRPFTGIIIGLITYAILGIISQDGPKEIPLVIISFLCGMRERKFTELLEKAADIVLTSKGDEESVSEENASKNS